MKRWQIEGRHLPIRRSSGRAPLHLMSLPSAPCRLLLSPIAYRLSPTASFFPSPHFFIVSVLQTRQLQILDGHIDGRQRRWAVECQLTSFLHSTLRWRPNRVLAT